MWLARIIVLVVFLAAILGVLASVARLFGWV